MTTTLIVPTDLSNLFDPAKAAETRAAVRANPGNALVLLGEGRNSGALTVAGQSRVLEAILGEVDDVDTAQELLASMLTPDAAAEIIAIRGDLPAIGAEVADQEMILSALSYGTEREGQRKGDDGELESYTFTSALLLKAWAVNLQTRPDWDELLDMQLGSSSLRDLLITAVLLDNDQDNEISADCWVEVGIDPIDAHERLEELRALDELPELDADEIARARKVLRDRAKAFEEASVAATAESVADDLEI